MKFSYDSRKPPGEQVIVSSIRVQGQRLVPDRLYTVTTNEIVLMFLPMLGIEAQDPQIRTDVAYEAARDLIRARRFLLPFAQGRIRDVAPLRR